MRQLYSTRPPAHVLIFTSYSVKFYVDVTAPTKLGALKIFTDYKFPIFLLIPVKTKGHERDHKDSRF